MPQTPGYGAYDAYGGNIGQGQQEGPSIKERLVGLMGAVRTLMRSKWSVFSSLFSSLMSWFEHLADVDLFIFGSNSTSHSD